MPEPLLVTVAPEAEGGEPSQIDAARLTLPDGYALVPAADYVPRATVDAQIADAVKARLRSHVARDKAAEDPEVVRAVRAKLDAEGAIAEDAIRQSVRAEFQPKLDRLAAMEAQVVHGAVVEAARAAGVRDEYLTPVLAGQPPPVVQMLGGAVRFDEERGYVVATHAGMPIPAKAATAERPFAGPEGLFEAIRTSAPHLFKADTPQGGAGYAGGTGAAQTKRSGMTATEKAAFIDQHGQDAYLALPE